MDMNIQTDHITDNEDIVFDSGKKGSKKYSRGKNALEDEKGNTDGSLPREEFCKSPPTATSEQEIQERESYNGNCMQQRLDYYITTKIGSSCPRYFLSQTTCICK